MLLLLKCEFLWNSSVSFFHMKIHRACIKNQENNFELISAIKCKPSVFSDKKMSDNYPNVFQIWPLKKDV